MSSWFERAGEFQEGSELKTQAKKRLRVWIACHYADAPREDQEAAAANFFTIHDNGAIDVREGFCFRGFDEFPIPPHTHFLGDLDLRDYGLNRLPPDILVDGQVFLRGCSPRLIAQAEQLKKQAQIRGQLRFD